MAVQNPFKERSSEYVPPALDEVAAVHFPAIIYFRATVDFAEFSSYGRVDS